MTGFAGTERSHADPGSRELGCAADTKESLQDRGFYVFCCHANLVVVLDVGGSNPLAHPSEIPVQEA